MHIGQRIQARMDALHTSQNKLAKAAQISQSGLSSIIAGRVSPKENTLQAIAKALKCNASDLIGSSDIIQLIHNAVPIVGDIACGVPITAEQNITGYADLPDSVHADFALRCKGDSMAPTFIDGDLVLIRQQPDVDDGQIAAVSIDGEATLKHVYHQTDGVLLVADNPAFSPIVARTASDRQILIHGLAVGYTRMF